MLEETGVFMKKDLATDRLKIVKPASKKCGFNNVWTFNGTVFAKTGKRVESYLNIFISI